MSPERYEALFKVARIAYCMLKSGRTVGESIDAALRDQQLEATQDERLGLMVVIARCSIKGVSVY